MKFIQDDIIYVHGIPKELVTDNGPHFTSAKFQNLVNTLSERHKTTCEYNPQANGMDERFNGTLTKLIRNYLEVDQTTWDRHLRVALFVHNTTTNEST